jgi:hypothetical protein
MLSPACQSLSCSFYSSAIKKGETMNCQLFFRLPRRLLYAISLMALLVLMPAGLAAAAEVRLNWDPNQQTDLAGYKIHYGTKSRTYSNTIDVGNRTSYSVTGLAPGGTYFFAATAYNAKGGESSYSNEVSTRVQASGASLGVTNLLPGDYQVAPLGTGDFYYTDRSFKITSLPPGFEGVTAIRTANNDKWNKQATFLSFALSQRMDLYVAYDARAIRMPSWLVADFTDTGLLIETTDATMTLWRRTIPAGPVTLPGNYYGDPAGPESNYFILLVPALSPSVTITNLLPADYQPATLRQGNTFYTDRNFTITGLPAGFEGMTLLRTANNDKYNSQAQLLSFSTDESIIVHVAYDARATKVPAWLGAGFTDSGQLIETTDTAMRIWRRSYPAGNVALPGNYFGSPSGSESNYFVILAPASGQAGPIAAVNFQPGDAAVPAGYKVDSGMSYAAARGYGWVSGPGSLGARVRNHSASPDQAYDSLIHVDPSARWEMALANGTYKVTFCVGDPDYPKDLQRVQIEGVSALNSYLNATSPWIEKTVTVNVTDGRLTLTFAGSDRYARLNWLKISR